MTDVLRFPTPAAPPPSRGRLMCAEEVAALIGGKTSPAWVRRNVPYKLELGHSTVRWFEADVLAWLEERRRAAISGGGAPGQ